MLHHFGDQRIRAHRILQFRLAINRLRKRDVQFLWHQIGKTLSIRGRQAHHARHILHRGLGLQSSKGDDLRHMPIFLAHIVQHFGAAILAHVHVNVGIFIAIRIGETLKKQPKLLRTRVGKTQHKSHHGSHAAASGNGRNSILPGPIHKVPHN